MTSRAAPRWNSRATSRSTQCRAYAETGADFVSCGAITHPAQAVNFNFRMDLLLISGRDSSHASAALDDE